MDLLGLPLSTLGPLYAAVAGAVVVLYLLKLRRRRVPVPSSRLWARVLQPKPASNLFAMLKRLLSLLLQLVLFGLIIAALGDPRLKGAAAAGRSIVVLVDGSASMKATDVPGTRARQGRDAVLRMVREMGPADRMLLAQMDAEVTTLTPMTDDPAELEAALRNYAPRDTGADLAKGLRFGLDALQGATSPELVVVGDGAYDPPRDAGGEVRLGRVPLRFVGVGRRGRNVGITAFAARRYPLDKSRYEVLVELRSWSDRTERVELTLSADGAPVDASRLTLEPGASVQRVLPDRTGADGTLEASVRFEDGSRDDLPADDRAYATLPERRRARVLSVTEGNRYLEAALLLDDYLDVVEATPAEATARLQSERFDVVIFDKVTAPVPPGTGVIWLRPEGPDAPMERAPGYAQAPAGTALRFEHVAQSHPVVRFASDLEEGHVGRIVRYTPTAADRVIASSAAGPMLIAGERRGGRFVLMSFDVRESDVALLISWPVMILNAIDWFTGEDPAYLSSFRTGEVWRVPVAAGVERATVEPPHGPRFTASVFEGRAVFLGAEAGFYRVHSGDEHRLAAGNLIDARESDCRPSATLTVGPTRATAPIRGRAGVRREVWVYLLALALCLLTVEWVTWHRRITV
ncbi:MAG: VWA domain-containing protein [Polyangiales bacterium]